MKFSAFARFSSGLRFSSKPSHGEAIYRAMMDAYGGAFATTEGSHDEARVYADAMALARVRYTTERAANQMRGSTALEMLPVLERKLGLVPSPKATVLERQAAVQARQVLPKGATRVAIEQALTAAIGADFLCYRTTKAAEVLTDPVAPGSGPGHWVRPSHPAKVVQLASPVAFIGSATVTYAAADPAETVAIDEGDQVVVSTNNIGLAELVTVTAAAATTFTATFTKAHDNGDYCTTGPFPYWVSNQRHSVIVVTPAAAIDAEKRRKVNRVMAEVSRGICTWDIAAGAGGTCVVMTTDDPLLGLTGYAPTGPVLTYP